MMQFWGWLTSNSQALQSLSAMASTVLTIVTIVVLIVTWKAIKEQAAEARALKDVAQRQTEVAWQQKEATVEQVRVSAESTVAVRFSNQLAIEANHLATTKMRSDLLPILVFDSLFNQEAGILKDAIRNVGLGPAKEVQLQGRRI